MSQDKSHVTQPCAVVVGVGAVQGIGGAVSLRCAREGLYVYVAGRTADKIEQVVAQIRQEGGQASAYVIDSTKPHEVQALFQHITDEQRVPQLVVHNVGGNTPSRFLHTQASFYEHMWRTAFFAGALVGQEAVRRMLPLGRGTIIFTGASASLRGKPMFAAFSSGKASLRNFAQSLDREFRGQGLHIAHVVIDGAVDGDRINQMGFGVGRIVRSLVKGVAGSLKPEAIADNYWNLHMQPPEAWTFELDLRPFKEKF